ncbi:hypothetical protein [Mammaliicoccus sciuri]|uniref:hypothetical protein n=1 Tax=Mammaliicoccus sciuri TaxID=1296 RepID=UPI002B25B01F|nr:hypothetical protein [Mammaliicoccus sciuri]WQK75241.1 hypothetical protein P3U33_05785 [Mammaliicoccus sciuri]
MNKGEKVTNTYFAVKYKDGDYANDYWGYSRNFTDNRNSDALIKNIDEAKFLFEEDSAKKMQVIKVTFEVMEEWEK